MPLMFGIIFTAVGAIIFLMGLFFAFMTGEVAILFMCLFSTPFLGLGIWALVSAKKAADRTAAILREGSLYAGRIVEYRDGVGATVNGVPPLDVVVRIVVNGQDRNLCVPTGSYSERDFPIGACVQVRMKGIEGRIVPGSVRLVEYE